ncbi:hypothetical protein TNCT_655311 [Trichonephila clavata]|uniref:Uncharacterized protein n=1 Tax=Trichonephila clavata TaxID=2740835 RepID=A0A8X6GYB1_TRICU|nr:hypothetical protein TNCT_655311 [Trichonephila clavata]
MFAINSYTSSNTSLNDGPIDTNMGSEVTGISSLNSFISNGSDLGKGHLTLINFLFKVQDIHRSHRIQGDTKTQSHHIHFSNKV